MKSSNTTSAAKNGPREAGRQSSSRSPHSPTSAEEFVLSGPSDDPDPRTHAFRSDLADAALAGQVIASHYAAPVERHLASGTTLRLSPDESADAVAKLEPEDVFLMLDDSLGWAWGYGGAERLVGYLPSAALKR